MKYTRELTAAVLSPVAIYIIGWSHAYVFDAAIALIAAGALYEFLNLGRRKGYTVPTVLCSLVMLFIIAAFILEPISVEMGVFLTLLIVPASFVFNPGTLEEALPSSAIAVMATLYVGMLGGSLIRLRNDFARCSRQTTAPHFLRRVSRTVLSEIGASDQARLGDFSR